MPSIPNASLALSMLQANASASAGAFSPVAIDFSVLGGGAGAASASVYGPGSIHLALAEAEKNEARQLAEARRQPEVKRDLERYAKVVSSAKTLEEVLDDPVARKVFLTANGLSEYADYPGLARKALASDPAAPDALAVRLASVNSGWLSTVRAFDLFRRGVAGLKSDAGLAKVINNYVAEKRLDRLDQQLPGLGTAILFKDVAATFDTAVKILGSRLGREVVTTALQIPRQIAVQSVEAQARAISARLDVAKLQDPAFVDRLVHRYLLATYGVLGGVTA